MNAFSNNYRLIAFPQEFSLMDITKFKEKLKTYAKAGTEPILVDCGNVEMIYSSGLGVIINGYKFCNDSKIYYGLVNVKEYVQKVITATNLHKILNVFPTLEEFELLELNDSLVGTKVPPLDFSYEEKTIEGKPLLACKGVMCEGSVFNKLLKSVSGKKQILFDFTELSFIDAECLDVFKGICSTSDIYIVGLNEILEDELKLFEILEKTKVRETLESASKDMK